MILEQTPRRLVRDLYRQSEHLRNLEAISANYPLLSQPSNAELMTTKDIETTRQAIAADTNR